MVDSGYGLLLKFREALSNMFKKMDLHSQWEADDFILAKIQENLVDVFFRGGEIVAVAAGLHFPSDVGDNRLLDIGRQPVNFLDHDDARKGQVRGEGGRRAFELSPGLNPVVYGLDDGAAPYIAVEPLAGGKNNYPLRGKSVQGVQCDTDVGRGVARHSDWDIDRISKVMTVVFRLGIDTPGGAHYIS